jgi:hypothetical protein
MLSGPARVTSSQALPWQPLRRIPARSRTSSAAP